MSLAPDLQHQRISQRISQLLGDAVSNCQQCEAVFAVDWKIDEHTIVQPDNLITCNKESGQYLSSAPVLIFAILSPATEKRDRTTIFEIYQREAVQHYCIVDPNEKVIKVYRLHQGRYIKKADVTEQTITFDIGHCHIELNFSTVWP